MPADSAGEHHKENSSVLQTRAINLHIRASDLSRVRRRRQRAGGLYTEVRDRFELFLAARELRQLRSPADGQRGSGYFEYNLNNTLGLVADIGGYANTRSGINDKLLTYMFGPRFNWRHTRLNPYAQFLFGGAYVWNNPAGVSTTQNAFATAAGGGLDYRLTNRIAIKPIQVEYVMTQIDSARGFGSHQNDIRYSAGVVLRFGEK